MPSSSTSLGERSSETESEAVSACLALPCEETGETIEAIVDVFYGGFLDQLLEDERALPRAVPSYCREILERFRSQGREDFEYLWTPNLLSVAHAAREGDPRVVERRVSELAFEQLECGRSHVCPSFTLSTSGYTLRLGDRVFDDVERVTYDSDSQKLFVSFRNGVNTYVKVVDSERPRGIEESPGHITRYGSVKTSKRTVLCLPQRCLGWSGGQFLRERANDRFLDGLDELAGSAIARLRGVGDDYSDWVERLLTYLSPWENRLGSRPGGSGSSGMLPGLVGICNFPHAASFVDSLIHEISHHHFYLATLTGSITDGTDSTLYENPFLDSERPIEKILLAYHAFANVLLHSRDACRAGSEDVEWLEQRIDILDSGLSALDRHLSTTRSLTDLGQGLWITLRERLDGQADSLSGFFPRCVDDPKAYGE